MASPTTNRPQLSFTIGWIPQIFSDVHSLWFPKTGLPPNHHPSRVFHSSKLSIWRYPHDYGNPHESTIHIQCQGYAIAAPWPGLKTSPTAAAMTFVPSQVLLAMWRKWMWKKWGMNSILHGQRSWKKPMMYDQLMEHLGIWVDSCTYQNQHATGVVLLRPTDINPTPKQARWTNQMTGPGDHESRRTSQRHGGECWNIHLGGFHKWGYPQKWMVYDENWGYLVVHPT